MKTTWIVIVAFASAAPAWAQSTPAEQQRHISQLIARAARSPEPALALLAGMSDLPDGTYPQAVIKAAIDDMPAFGHTPQGSEDEFLALLDRWAAVDGVLGATRRLTKRGQRLHLERDSVQSLPLGDGEVTLGEDVALKLAVHGEGKVLPQILSELKPGSWVTLDDVRGVTVDGGALKTAYVHSDQAQAHVNYFVQNDLAGVWRHHAFSPRTTPARAPQAAGDWAVDGAQPVPLYAGHQAQYALKQLAPGTRVDVLSEADAPMWQVRVGDQVGYVHEDQLRDARNEPTPTYVVKLRYGIQALPLRADADSQAAVRQRLQDGAELALRSQDRDPWWEVEVGGRTGFVHKDHLRPLQVRQGLARQLSRRLGE